MKRKARKKRQLGSVGGAVAGEDEHKTAFSTVLLDCPEDSVLDCPEDSVLDCPEDSVFEESLASASIHLRSGIHESTEDNRTGGDDDVASISTVDTSNCLPVSAVPVEGETLQVDWNAAEPPLETVEDSNVELEVDWSENADLPCETRWSAWASNGLTGVRAEWHWVGKDHPTLTAGRIRAHMKNTFVEMEHYGSLGEKVRRAKSAPAPKRCDRSR